MADVIQLRRDFLPAWESANPVLAQGELGVVLDDSSVKIGDGITPWVDLPTYFSPAWMVTLLQGVSELDGRATAVEQGVSELDGRATAVEQGVSELDGRATAVEQGVSDIEILALAGL
jgi:ABC-type amino acid transport substrate-binding protein